MTYDDVGVFRMSELEARLSLTRQAIYKLMKVGDFPRPVRLTGRAVGWRREDVRAWIESRPLTEVAA